MATPAAKRREIIVIQRKNLVDNGVGGRRRPDSGPEWINVASDVFAEIIPLRGQEALHNLVLRAVQLYRVTINARAGITTDYRLMWGSTPMAITSAALSPDRRDLVMTCESGVPT